MKIQIKLAIMLAVVAIMSVIFQTAGAFPKPVPGIGTYKPIPGTISIKRADETFNSTPQPGFNVTLLMNQTVHFKWFVEKAKNFVIKDENGKKVFETNISSANSLDIKPSEIKLAAGKNYSWSVDDTNFYEFTVLDAKNEKDLLQKLSEIDKNYSSPEERIVKKANYVQMLSDAPEYNLDLYWLSAQWLSQISPTDEELKKEKSYLLKECDRHYLLEKSRYK